MIKRILKRDKEVFIGIIVGMMFTTVTAYAAYCVWAKDVGFVSSSGLTSTNVQDAIDELALKADACTVAPPSNVNPTPTPAGGPVCRRATTLHSEVCKNSQCTSSDGTVSVGETVTYGQLGTQGSLASGDAFDCDVNGDGTYDPDTERFYYLTDLDTNDNYATLIYSSNTSYDTGDLTAINTIPTDYSYGSNQSGPLVAQNSLPRDTDWSNVSLFQNTMGPACRYIRRVDGSVINCYDYRSDVVSRLVYANEIKEACDFTTNGVIDPDYNIEESFNGCSFLTENTSYTDSTLLKGYYIHDIVGKYNNTVTVEAGQILNYRADKGNEYGVRPVIEVLKTDMSY